MRLELQLLIAAFLVASPACAQTFPSQTQSLPTLQQRIGPTTTATNPVDPQGFLLLEHLGRDNAGNQQIEVNGALPLTAFAGSADVIALRSDTTSALSRLDYKLSRGVALASAAEIQGPAPGKDNRIGGTITTFDGQAAGSVSLSHRSGAFDVGGAVAFAKGQHLAKAGAGFSF